ncbi:GDSL-type esterase/lipase family protein [Streptomyces europaeiscabiei]|uniref:GDSL-type esterase/lipase family protein n=1 Tax=Streptomyces europaeiscabiei TaxID=146819 RepID=UPI0029AB7249|nr:GDSL-type esterase/lipase family protein [Streptomyces europaeiscabiei]MDX3581548.1 GDSL-type esterase/lipase family protein [Streptomyces europaeiscabiei]MDX3633038.1 GDSL-type esterase/lipase family protein [Streptomyces europaeiscabiei]MDX3650453.1 GDSL-type esterase/lipase family protein [Streptomyces europaeiscabiei]
MTSTRTGTTWIAAHRSAVIDPQEAFKLFEVRSFTDQTVRQTLRPAGGGEALRVRLSNLYGRTPLDIGGAHLARRTEGSAIDPATDVTLLFAGAETVTVPPGEEIISDPVEGPVTAGEELALSLYLPGDTGLTTHTAIPYDVGHAVPGDQLTAASLDESDELITGHFVTGIDVLATDNTRIAVAFGDSWIEGMATTPGTGSSFPAQLDRRLTDGWVVATGISGNRLLTDEIGAHLLSRVDHDVLDIPGASHVIIHAGLNDLGLPGAIAFPEPAKLPTAADLTTALTALADRLRTAGLTVIGSTIGPYAGTVYPGYDTDEGQAVRAEVNTWLLGDTHPFDAVIDIAAAVADPDHPTRIHDDYNSGDGLHVNDAGAKAIADAVDLSLLNL